MLSKQQSLSSTSLLDGERIPVSTGQFSVRCASTTVTVARVTAVDYIPPSRVTDLTITHIRDKVVNLTWSAPGGDLDQGSGRSIWTMIQ